MGKKYIVKRWKLNWHLYNYVTESLQRDGFLEWKKYFWLPTAIAKSEAEATT